MVHLPTTFFRQLNSVIYQFVWHNCKPKIKYTRLWLDPKLGGLGHLDPGIQQQNLQIRWLRQLLKDNHPQSCKSIYITRSHSSIPFRRYWDQTDSLFPSLRLHPAAHVNNFMQSIYKTVDSFGYADTRQAKCTPATLLRLPLSAIFAVIPADYWITQPRHKNSRRLHFLRMIATLDAYILYCHLICLIILVWSPSYAEIFIVVSSS
ncbi:hypothetical protein G6F57_010045 [Rhizopus arrhizus]|uniref:Uncharacterized protein n=1 Tax=Rhizopus oryzae TaxID=64495 RepID=A0A9P6X2I3_RHIOR|nr:hypothetical protein G6F23_005956 [Rhizopus arrhizus]KAG1414060.1 hypothetical protein G6F58_007152 [Rhizopus delemar]KAG0758266.1 hypothetical protein G6F24_009910 [Rhizopus arrhizus]KAG0781677.1 hypothetical protein G6F21_011520 [Rhizopus arrhizus]KAG0781966.1 hypothetical protein G6F22_009323 [Rhizopus arrhizus]